MYVLDVFFSPSMFSRTVRCLVLSMVFSGGLVLEKSWFSIVYCCLYWTTELVLVAAFFFCKRLNQKSFEKMFFSSFCQDLGVCGGVFLLRF